MRAIHIYTECTNVTIDYWDIRLSVATSFISEITEQIPMIYQMVSNYISYIIWKPVFIEIQAYQYSDIISYFLKLAWHLLWQMTALLDMSFDYVMETACIQTITILYVYFYIWEFLDLTTLIFIFLSLISVLVFIIIVIILNFWITPKPLRVYPRFRYHK